MTGPLDNMTPEERQQLHVELTKSLTEPKVGDTLIVNVGTSKVGVHRIESNRWYIGPVHEDGFVNWTECYYGDAFGAGRRFQAEVQVERERQAVPFDHRREVTQLQNRIFDLEGELKRARQECEDFARIAQKFDGSEKPVF